MRYTLPLATRGQIVGLFGGSFDPPHEGHVLVSKRAFRRVGVDQLWWLFSPGNPLKNHQPAPLAKRIAAARGLVDHPRLHFSDIETRIETRFTADTIAAIRGLYPHVRFVWIMGADNLVQFHKWDRSDEIMRTLPVVVMARPGEQNQAGLSPTARRFAPYRWPQHKARAIAHARTPAWVMLTGASMDRSSSKIRANGDWP